MSVQILVAKYVDDIRRWEPRNVGLLVRHGDTYAGRFVGEREDGTVDGRKLRWNEDSEIYRDWIRFWRGALSAGESGVAEALRLSVDNYLLVDAGEVWIGGEDFTAEQILDRYYHAIVDQRTDHQGADEEPSLFDLAESVLARAGATLLTTFRHDFEVEGQMTVPGAAGTTSLIAEPYRFHYGWQNGHTVVAHRVALGDQDRVDAALWRFGHLPEEYASIALVRGDTRTRLQSILMRQLEVITSLVVDVEVEDAPLRLRPLLIGE